MPGRTEEERGLEPSTVLQGSLVPPDQEVIGVVTIDDTFYLLVFVSASRLSLPLFVQLFKNAPCFTMRKVYKIEVVWSNINQPFATNICYRAEKILRCEDMLVINYPLWFVTEAT